MTIIKPYRIREGIFSVEKYSKQPYIMQELERRIKGGFYTEKLPKSTELATEFGVNFKTIDKAINKLAAR